MRIFAVCPLTLSLLFGLSSFSARLECQESGQKPSGAHLRVAQAQEKVRSNPSSAAHYNELAAALCRKGRATEDLNAYLQAETAIAQALALSKDNYEARKLQVATLLGKHEYAAALQLATQLNRKIPDDLEGWAALADINMALGNYSEAERQAQWVLDLRPGSALGFEKAAALREVFGDLPGAVEFLDEAYRRTPSSDTEQRSWLLAQKSRLQLVAGYDKEAEVVILQALQLSPASQVATAVLARIRMAQGQFSESADLLGKRYAAVKNAGNLFDWAEALDKSGQKEDATARFREFMTEAERESDQAFNTNLQLVSFYLNRRHEPARALALAAKMAERRHDVATLDAYAWSLFANGRFPEAKTQMDRLLAVGVREPLYFCHAAQIAAKTGHLLEQANYQRELATFKHASCLDEQAATLSTATASNSTLTGAAK